ncbi:MAG: hypothetical protein ABF633_03000 [Clostridium sp.]|uniref:hypothetical protein n=1 Tax=Clostridium sp. TaxID=1506 RepID=UPI0039E7896F
MGKRRIVTDKKIKEVLNLRKQGKSYRDIMLAARISQNSVIEIIKEHENKNV